MPPLISVVILTKNGEMTIDACLRAIFNQTVIGKTEVIVIDSGSTDRTLEIIKKYSVRLHQIQPEEFKHGKTRNLGVELSSGKFVVMTVQDAVATSNNWLEIMLQHFEKEQVAAVCGQQAVPHEKDKNPAQWFRPVSKPGFHTKHFSKSEFLKLSPHEQWQNCRWDDVNAMYRKSVIAEIPFRDVPFGEDMAWAKDALSNEHTLVYDSRSSVWHYHHYTNKEKIYQRVISAFSAVYDIFGYIRPNPFTFKYILRNSYICLKYRIKPYWWFYNLRLDILSHFAVRKFMKKHYKKTHSKHQ